MKIQNHPTPLTQFIKKARVPQENSEQFEPQFTARGWMEGLDIVKSVYIHIPFCFHKCHYCDFYSIAGAEDQYEPFVKQLTKELEFVGKHLSSIETIFVGGGTPTIFDIDLFDEMLAAIATHIPRSQNCEWTIEANPETITLDKVKAMVSNGINRVSIGAQSFNKELLKTLERWHEIDSVRRAVDDVRHGGIENINLDTIYAIPGQTQSQLLFDLEQATALLPTHLSCYSLIYEPGTPLRTRLDRGDVQRVEHNLEAAMFECVLDVLVRKGYEQYEISNFAKSGYECKHNIAYWTNQSWWPFGPSASGHLEGRRWKNTPKISHYINGEHLPPIIDIELLSPDKSAGEAFMVGLRLKCGMEKSWVERLVAQSNNEWRALVIEHYIKDGLLHWQGDYLALTEDGLCFADTVITGLLMQDETITDTKEQPIL